MSFAYPLPWWVLAPVVVAAALLAYRAYSRSAVPLAPRRRALLVGLRFLTLLLLIVCLMRPVALDRPENEDAAVVPILIDASRSMRLEDEGGTARVGRAIQLVRSQILPALESRYRAEVLTFGEGLGAAELDRISPVQRRSDLVGALREVRERFRGRTVAGVVVISDGGDTGEAGRDGLDLESEPVYAIGVGSREGLRDREVVGVTAGDPGVIDSMVEIQASLVSRGAGRTPFDVRVLENGRPIQVRRVQPSADGSPVREAFHVAPPRDAATRYTIEVPSDAAEITTENNARSVIVRPPGRRRRVLMVQGAPGHEHSFLARAWLQDPGLELSSVTRKGQNDRGAETFYVQAPAAAAAALASGFPSDRAALFAYDALVLANVEADFLTRDQLAMIERFVSERGGGLLVLGARSFSREGLSGTPLEPVLPVDPLDRTSDVVRTAAAAEGANRLTLTDEGAIHPIMQLGSSVEETRQRWAAAPPLSAATPMGGLRPGGTVLAVTSGSGRVPRALVAVQRYGRGRSMAFSGEASWRWKMMLASSDRTYDTFWRQSIRWLASPAPDPVAISVAGGAAPGDSVTIEVTARDAAFAAVRDALIRVRVTAPGGEVTNLEAPLHDAANGTYRAVLDADQPGVYRVRADATRGRPIGAAEEWLLVGAADPEFTDPRLNEEVLRRLALATGGRLLSQHETASLTRMLDARTPPAAPPVSRDLWNSRWVFAAIAALLFAEWVLRRREGLR
jgi:uncharacterized membrane protein